MIALLYARLRGMWPAQDTVPQTTYSPITADVVALQTRIDHAMAMVDELAVGRTRYEGQPLPIDEQLVAEIRRLRLEILDVRSDLADAKFENINGY